METLTETTVLSTVLIQAGAETTMKEPSILSRCAAHAAEEMNKEMMMPVMTLEMKVKAILAETRVKMTTLEATVMLAHVLTPTSTLLEK